MSNKEAIRILAKWLEDATKDCTGDRLGYVNGWFAGYDIDAFVQAIQALKVVDTLSTLIEQGKVYDVTTDQLKQVVDEYMGNDTYCSCANCKNDDSVYCEPDNREKYGYCGNWCRKRSDEK